MHVLGKGRCIFHMFVVMCVLLALILIHFRYKSTIAKVINCTESEKKSLYFVTYSPYRKMFGIQDVGLNEDVLVHRLAR